MYFRIDVVLINYWLELDVGVGCICAWIDSFEVFITLHMFRVTSLREMSLI